MKAGAVRHCGQEGRVWVVPDWFLIISEVAAFAFQNKYWSTYSLPPFLSTCMTSLPNYLFKILLFRKMHTSTMYCYFTELCLKGCSYSSVRMLFLSTGAKLSVGDASNNSSATWRARYAITSSINWCNLGQKEPLDISSPNLYWKQGQLDEIA